MSRADARPNILLIMPDQMRGDALSAELHPVLMTPNIDEIGGRGVRFTRAYTTCPSCIAARRSLLTGLFPATHGLVGYQEGFPLAFPTLPQLLRDAGYYTALAGRYMHQWPPEESHGFEREIRGSSYIGDDDYARALEATLPGAGGIRGIGITFNGWSARPWPYAEHLHPTAWTTTQARRILAEHDSGRPLFLTASFIAPHPPLIPPPFYFERYLRSALPALDLGTWAAPPQDDGLGTGVDANRCVLRGDALRCAQAGYFGLINHIDDQIYWLIHEFCDLSRRDRRPWLIVFTSDHGEMLGDHYYFRKGEPYEGSSRIPLLIQGSPELAFRSGAVSGQPVCLEDIMPTLLEAAGAPPPAQLDGRSLVPLLRGDDTAIRPWLHGEHAPAYSEQQAFHMLTDGRMKYIWRPCDGTEQLFDLRTDPHELRDLAPESCATTDLSAWRARLVARLAKRQEGFSDGKKLVPGRPYSNIVPTG